ncbi:MAG: cation transporter [Lachnospiraceae bacterium]|nr:cation transporter [Lachnospiraceae bacterium]
MNQDLSTKKPAKDAQRIATQVSLVSVIGNIILTAFKLLAGILAKSQVMISDAVHSASDVVSSLIVIAGVKISGRKADDDHPYGHERFECVAAIILAAVLVIVGGTIGIKAVKSIISGGYREQAMPGLLALIASIVSIVAKGAMSFYTRVYAKQINSTALMAEAWHHLSDSLSSIGALIGIAGARMGVPILEPIASIVICLLILKAAYDIFRAAIDQMVDKSCSEEQENAIRECVRTQEGVADIDMLQTRMFGNRIYVDVEIAVDKNLTIEEGHDIAERVHDALEQQFSTVKHVMVHVNPTKE